MSAIAIAVFALALLLYVTVSERLDRAHITAPMAFIAVGAVVGLSLVHDPDPAPVRGLAELTLALVLFHDAAEIQPRELRGDVGVCGRLLLVALPITVLGGYVLARVLFPDAPTWTALLLAAALAPTDAGLGAATVLNPVVPVRVRRILNVESGLNDGLTTPVVLFALAAGATGGEGQTFGTALRELADGALVGTVVGTAAGLLLSWAYRSGSVERDLLPIGTVALPLLCYYGAVASDGNGFVAAFVAGTAFAAAAHRPRGLPPTRPLALTASGATLLGYGVWTLFGAILIAHLGELATWHGLVFALLSLTALRMVPVALVLLGTGFARPTRWFVGWFGPRGLASVVFALLAVEDYPDRPEVGAVAGTIALTVLLSVVLHGATADVGAARYGAWATRVHPPAESRTAQAPTAGRGTRRHWHVPTR